MHPRTKRSARARLGVVLMLSLAGSAATAAAAGANTVTSQNWSGYAVHRSGVSFKKVSATWRQPTAACTRGQETYSAFWVGIGGYRLSSNALEQIGSELDCTASGSESMAAWYELVPKPSHTIPMTIGAGDRLTTSVSVSGRRVTLRLTDATRHESFAKTIAVTALDTSSAEWIAEAPSECSTSSTCTTLPLANFGSIGFSRLSAETTSGATGVISSSLWDATKLLLGYQASGAQFAAKTTTANATPTSPTSAGSGFRVSYSGATTTTSPGPGGGRGGDPSGSQRR